jgi:hypothetical protein
MRFETFFAKILRTCHRTRAQARSKWRIAAAERDWKGARFSRLAAQAAANFRFEKGFFEDSRSCATFINSKPQRRLARQVESPLSAGAAFCRNTAGMVMGRLVADEEDWTRVLRSRC